GSGRRLDDDASGGEAAVVPEANLHGRSSGAQRPTAGRFPRKVRQRIFVFRVCLRILASAQKKSGENDFFQGLAHAEPLDFGYLDPYRNGRRAAITLEWQPSRLSGKDHGRRRMSDWMA